MPVMYLSLWRACRLQMLWVSPLTLAPPTLPPIFHHAVSLSPPLSLSHSPHHTLCLSYTHSIRHTANLLQGQLGAETTAEADPVRSVCARMEVLLFFCGIKLQWLLKACLWAVESDAGVPLSASSFSDVLIQCRSGAAIVLYLCCDSLLVSSTYSKDVTVHLPLSVFFCSGDRLCSESVSFCFSPVLVFLLSDPLRDQTPACPWRSAATKTTRPRTTWTPASSTTAAFWTPSRWCRTSSCSSSPFPYSSSVSVKDRWALQHVSNEITQHPTS